MIPHIDTQLYDYELPEEKIARYPLERRDNSKLLTYKHGTIGQTTFNKLLDHLPTNATLVFNNTKVIRARLKLQKETGAQIEIFCLEPIEPIDIQQSFATTSCVKWKCIIGNSKKWKEGSLRKTLTNGTISTTLSATRISIVDNTSIVEFSWDNRVLTFADIIDLVGVTPIPPYLNRETEDIDTERYQTVYSEHKGSVAAPTAGLHFSDEIMQELRSHGHQLINVTLHVGAGTFKPVQTKEISSHIMHTEHIVVERSAIEMLRNNSAPLFAVGTTSVRTLESLYWLGVKLHIGEDISNGLEQWDAYRLPTDIPVKTALDALIALLDKNKTDILNNQTQIMIVPGYKFRIVKGLITNFHQPHSTLLLLIGAFVGDKWHEIYDYALNNDFRFLSYGDSSILIP